MGMAKLTSRNFPDFSEAFSSHRAPRSNSFWYRRLNILVHADVDFNIETMILLTVQEKNTFIIMQISWDSLNKFLQKSHVLLFIYLYLAGKGGLTRFFLSDISTWTFSTAMWLFCCEKFKFLINNLFSFSLGFTFLFKHDCIFVNKSIFSFTYSWWSLKSWSSSWVKRGCLTNKMVYCTW